MEIGQNATDKQAPPVDRVKCCEPGLETGVPEADRALTALVTGSVEATVTAEAEDCVRVCARITLTNGSGGCAR
jgi:hypothetical protein